MQDEHGFIWQAMLDTIDVDLAGRRVLDAGCNRGGFLRLLVDAEGVDVGYGYDPAAGAVTDARRLAGDRPLTFEVADTVPDGWGDFDVAFSHEVLYLLDDLPAHAAALLGALKPGGSYFAVMGVHDGSPMMSAWHAASAVELGLPRLYPLDEVADLRGNRLLRSGGQLEAGVRTGRRARARARPSKGPPGVVGLLHPGEGGAAFHPPVLLAPSSSGRPHGPSGVPSQRPTFPPRARREHRGSRHDEAPPSPLPAAMLKIKMARCRLGPASMS